MSTATSSIQHWLLIGLLLPLGGLAQTAELPARAVCEPDTMVAGAVAAGDVLVQVFDQGEWRDQVRITSPYPAPFVHFGAACALQGDTLLIGEDATGLPTPSGSVWLFGRTDTGWTLRQQFHAPNPAPGDRFGYKLLLSGNSAEIGAKDTIFLLQRRAGIWVKAGSRLDSLLAIGPPSRAPARAGGEDENPLPKYLKRGPYGPVLTPMSVLMASPPALTSSSWTAIGPAPLAAADNPVGMVSGRITGIAADPTNPQNIYIAAAGGGVWQTTDGGSTWNPLTDNQATLSMGAIAIAPSSNQVLYAGTGEANGGDSNYGVGMLTSTNGGQTWTLGTGPGGIFQSNRVAFAQISVHPTNAGIAYAAVANAATNGSKGGTGIYKTTNGGAIWTNVTAADGLDSTYNWTAVQVDPNTPTIVYAAHGAPAFDSRNGVYRSTDSGATWTLLNAPFNGSTDTGRIALAVAPSANVPNSHRLYVVVEKISTKGLLQLGMYNNADAAAPSFTSLPATPDFLGGENTTQDEDGDTTPGGQGNYDIVIGVDPAKANVVYGGGVEKYGAMGAPIAQNVEVSTNGGTSWTDISTVAGLSPHTDCHAIAFDSNSRMLIGTDGGIWRYDPSGSGSWTNLNGNLNTIQFEGLGLHPTDPGIALAGSQDNGVDLYSGKFLWKEVVGGDGGTAVISQNDGSVLYGLNNGGPQFVNFSKDGGKTWDDITPKIGNTNLLNFYPPMVLDADNGSSIFLGGDILYTSTDQGEEWNDETNPASPAANINTLAALPGGNIIYAATGGNFNNTTIHYSSNGGSSWTERDLPNVGSVHELDLDPNDSSGATAYAVINTFNGADGQVYKTVNGGTTWTNISGNLPQIPTWSLKVDSDANHTVYVSNDTGVYSSTSPYNTWNVFGAGLPHAQGFQLQLNSSKHLLAVATHGRGVWEILTATTVTNVSSAFADGTYGAGTSIPIQVQFAANVNVAGGTPKLALDSGGTATYNSGSGTNILTFTYKVGSTDSTNGEDLDATTLTLNGATLTGANGKAAVLALPGAGETGSLSANSNIKIAQVAMTIQKSHSGNFQQGGTGSYTIRATNSGAAATNGSVVTVTDTLPIGLSATAISGSNWNCTLATLVCTRSDTLAANSNYPDITLSVTVAGDAPSSVANKATVSYAGMTDTASDPTTVNGTPELTIGSSHSGNFTQGQVGAVYLITVSNTGGATASGGVIVTDTLPAGLTATAISGTNWSCSLNSLTCTRADSLAANASYPSILLTVNVAANAPASVTNSVGVTGSGQSGTGSDPTNVNGVPNMTIQGELTVGPFTLGQTGVYGIYVTNSGAAPTSAPVLVADSLPGGLTVSSITGNGWTCTAATVSCTRSDVLLNGYAYPPITLTVNVSSNASSPATNTVTVSGGGELNKSDDSSSFMTNLVTAAPNLTIASQHSGAFTQGQTGAAYSLTVSNTGTAAANGAVTVTDNLPPSLTPTAISGTNWTCTLATVSCTRGDGLAMGASYSAITVTVTVASNAPASVTNSATITGGSTASDPTTITSVVPVLNQIFPDTTASGGASFTLTAIGAYYVANSVVYWNGTALTTTLQSPTVLTATVPASLIAASGTAKITVSNPGGSSGYAPFTIAAGGVQAFPSLSLGYGWNPVNGLFTGAFLQMTSFSSGLELGTTVSWNGTSLGTVGLQSGKVGVSVPASLIQVPGAPFVNTANPGGSPFSNQLLIPSLRTLTSILPAAKPLGSGAFSLTVNGTGFASGDQIYVLPGAQALLTTFVNATQLQAVVPASVLTANDTLEVWVNTAVTNIGNFSSTNQLPLTVGTGLPILSVSSVHTGNFTQSQQNATYTVTVSNNSGAATLSTPAVTLTDTLPAGLTLVSMAGTNWNCTLVTASCSRSDSLAAGASFPAITVTVNVSGTAGSSLTNSVSVSGGGTPTNATASDLTTISSGLPDLTIAMSHAGNFFTLETGATYTITITNNGIGATSGKVTVTDAVPSGFTATAISGTNWTCGIVANTASCTRADALAAGANYPAISLQVSVSSNPPQSLTNSVTVGGGGETNTANDTAADPTTITPPPDLTIAIAHNGNFFQRQTGATYTITVSNIGAGQSNGKVTVTDTVPGDLTATAISGQGWTCVLSTVSCTRTDTLASASQYPAITLTVTISATAAATVTNPVQVSGGGEVVTSNDTAADQASVTAASADMVISVSDSGNFSQKLNGATYTITVSNAGTLSSLGGVTVTFTVTTGLTPITLSGNNWACNIIAMNCSRSDSLAAGANYDLITFTVNVTRAAPASATMVATVSGGGETNMSNDQVQDVTPIIQAPQLLYYLPTSAVAGGPAFTLAMNGVGIAPGAVVTFNGTALNTTVVSSTYLTASVPASLIASPGSVFFEIVNGGTATSSQDQFNIFAALGAASVGSATAGYGWDPVTGLFTGAYVQVAVSNAEPGLTAAWNGTNLGTVTLPPSGPPTAPVPSNLIQTPGAASVTLTNPGAGPSTASGSLTVQALRTLTSLAPQTVTPGSANFLLTVNGSGFGNFDTIYVWPGPGALTTTFVSATQLQATVPATALVSPGTIQVWVAYNYLGSNYSSTNQLPLSVASSVDMTISKMHTGNFTQGQAGVTYNITASNIGTVASSGLVTVTDTVPAGLAATDISGSGWTCTLATTTCTRSDALAAGGSYPPLTLTATVSATAPASVTNTATVSGGGETNLANDTATDITTILAPPPDITIAASHTGTFAQSQTLATYTLTASNVGVSSSSGLVTLTDTLPAGLTATSMVGQGWSCTLSTLTCTRSDALAPGGSYPSVTVAMTVAANAAANVTNTVTISGGGEINTSNDVASDSTTITGPLPDLTITKSHTGNFTQGQTGATYTITVSNSGAGPTNSAVTMVDTLPAGLTATGLAGTNWNCTLATVTCTRSDALPAGSSYPAVTLTVTVALNAQLSLINTAAVSGGGETNTGNDVTSDTTTINPQTADLTISKSHTGSFTQGQAGAYTIAVSNVVGAGATSGLVTVTDNLPASLTATAISGTGWTCTLSTVSCTRSDVLAAASVWPAITLAVTVAADAPTSVTNAATVSGGGEVNTANDQAQDATSIAAANQTQTITFPLSGVTFGVAPFTISATASSGLPVIFTSIAPVVCGVAGNTVTIVAAGTCVIQASQPGNSTYIAAAPVLGSFTVAPFCSTVGAPPANVTDVQLIIGEVLGTLPATDDQNRDGKLNILDVQMVVEAALNSRCPSM